jgi:hypothetical protein
MIASITSFSESNTRAGPVIDGFLRPGDLRDASFRGEIASQDREMALRRTSASTTAVSRPDRARLRRHIGKLFADRAAGDRHAVAVQDAVRQQIFSTCGTPPARCRSTAT